MNRDDLDGFFARADDVLTDWHGSPDAMNTVQRPAVLGVGWLTLPWSSPHADVLGDLQAAIRASQHTAYFLPVSDEILIEWGRDGAGINAVHSPPVDAPPHPWERALEARRTRNTGPPDPRRLDGRRTRR